MRSFSSIQGTPACARKLSANERIGRMETLWQDVSYAARNSCKAQHLWRGRGIEKALRVMLNTLALMQNSKYE